MGSAIDITRGRTELALAEGNFQLALALSSAIYRHIVERKLRLYDIEALTTRALALVKLSDAEQALHDVENAIRLALERGALWSEWHARRTACYIARVSGKPEGAQEHCERAREILERLASNTPGNLRSGFVEYALKQL
jgi:hypothetical protein